jgi:hypothetical protein
MKLLFSKDVKRFVAVGFLFCFAIASCCSDADADIGVILGNIIAGTIIAGASVAGISCSILLVFEAIVHSGILG